MLHPTLLTILTIGFLPAANAQFTTPGTALPVTNLANSDSFGASVALSADGATAIVGAPGTGPIIPSDGAVYVWVLSDGAWMLQQMIVAGNALGDGTLGSRQGASVSLSADGNTALYGGPNDDSGKGAAWVYIRDDQGVWHQQMKLIGDPTLTGQEYAAGQGNSVALSGDGNTAFVGGNQDDQATGAVWVFTRTGTTWTQQAKLVAAGTPTLTMQGQSVATSYDGNTLIVGGPGYGNTMGEISRGNAWIWTRTAGQWSSQPVSLNAFDVNSTAQQGQTVALSADGTIALVGAIGYDDVGAVVVWTLSGGQWTEQTKLVGNNAIRTEMGYSLSFTYNGSMALAGSPADASTRGSAFLFAPATAGFPMQNLEAASGKGQGFSVALSAYGGVALVGAPLTSSSQGAVWAYTAPATPISVDTSPTGLPFSVDSVVFPTGPVTLNLPNGQHTIAVSTSETDSSGNPYQFENWSDGGAASHSIAVSGVGNTYTAAFEPQQYLLATQVSPAGGGTVTPATGQSYNAKTMVALTATPANGYYFVNWTGNVANANSASTTVAMSAAETVTANFALISSLPNSTIQTVPAGLQVSIDGAAAQTAPQTLKLIPGSHTLAVASPQSGPAGTQYVFASWSDNGAASHSITAGTSAATYTATFTTQYQLTISASPSAGGTVSPVTGTYFVAGTVVPVAATPNAGYNFSGWTGAVASPSSASTVATLNGPLTLTANFASLTGITIQTNPPGLQVSVDGGTAQTAPQTLQLNPGSHTIAVSATQAGSPGTQYVFASWNDGGAASHSITVTASAATYTATFTTQYQLTISGSPAAGGTVTPASGQFYNSGTSVPIGAAVSSGYQFSSWSGPAASTSSASTTVTMSAPETLTANFSAVTGITIQTNPPGLQFTVDGGAPQTAPQTLNLTPGSHTIAVAATQPGPTGTQYVFLSWSDVGAVSHAITVGSSAATYIATFQTQYQLTISASSAAGGTVTPSSGAYYNAGTSVPIAATAAAGFTFSGWTGSVASASSASTTVTISAPETVTANFTALAGITIQTIPTGLQFMVDGGPAQTAPQSLSLPAGTHIIAVATTQGGTVGTQYVFASWSDGGAASHTITVGSTAATYTATFLTQYQLTITAAPAGDGTVTPPSGGFYTAGTSVAIAATAASGFQFSSWTGSVASSTSASTTVTVSTPESVTANFTAVAITNGLAFYPLTPCRAADSRNANGPFGGPIMSAGTTRNFTIPQSACNIPSTAQAYSLNITVVPPAPLSYLTVWPTGQTQPYVSTLNSLNGAILANAAIVPAGANGAISIYVSDATNVIIDINGYFAPPAASTLAFYPVTPCRVVDTRNANGPFGGPSLGAGGTRSFTVPQSSCGIPTTAQAYSLNMTVAPPGPLDYLTVWPAGQTQPYVSTLNALQGQIAANAAIVPAGTNGAISVYVSDASNVIVDINGYFAPPGTGALYFYPVTPCRVADTRASQGFTGAFGPPSMAAGSTRAFPIPSSSCALPSTAQAYSFNVTVVPPEALLYLSTWPAGQSQPVVSTLNDLQGQVIANAAIVPAGASGGISVYVSDPTDVIIDVNGYFGQ